MANELVHASVGVELTQTEWEALTAHQFNSQATGDLPYASSATQLSRLAIGAADAVLSSVSGVPAYRTLDALLELLVRRKNWRHILIDSWWTSAVTGSGSVFTGPMAAQISTDVTAGSTAQFRTGNRPGWSVGQLRTKIQWNDLFVWRVVFSIFGNTTNGIARWTVGKPGGGIGALATQGVGFRVDNLALKGIVYKVGPEATVDLATTLVLDQEYSMVIVHNNGTTTWHLAGTQVGTTASGPTGLSTAGQATLQVEVENGADAVDQSMAIIDQWFLGV